MRLKKEVQYEIDWRTREIESIKKEIEDKTCKESDKDFMLERVQNLSFAIAWCKWFLNEK